MKQEPQPPERLVLTEGQSEHLRAEGVNFAIVAPGSYPDSTGRAVLHLLSIDQKAAEDAIAVALEKAKAIRRRKGTPSPSPPPDRGSFPSDRAETAKTSKKRQI